MRAKYLIKFNKINKLVRFTSLILSQILSDFYHNGAFALYGN